MKITIITSITPSNISNQIEAINSWHTLSDSIISINTAEEINKVSGSFKNVVFVEASRSAIDDFGKPYIYIDDILKEFITRDTDICAIINSDIMLTSDSDIVDFVAKEAHESLVYGSRIDVNDFDNLKGKGFFFGFDFFIFDSKLIGEFMGTSFCLGLPWWDFLLPFTSIVKGHKTKRLITPFVYHKSHNTNWNQDSFNKMGNTFINYAYGLLEHKSDYRELLDCLKSKSTIIDVNIYILFYLRKKSKFIRHIDSSAAHYDNETGFVYRNGYVYYFYFKLYLKYLEIYDFLFSRKSKT